MQNRIYRTCHELFRHGKLELMTLVAGEFIRFVSLMTFPTVQVAQMVFMHVVGLHFGGFLGERLVLTVAHLALFGFDAFGGRIFLVAGAAGESLGYMAIGQKSLSTRRIAQADGARQKQQRATVEEKILHGCGVEGFNMEPAGPNR